MSDAVIVGALSIFGALLVAAFGWIVAQLVRLNNRILHLEHRDRLSWLYIRSLIVSHTTAAPGVPLPDPPDGWLEGDGT